MAQIFKAGEGAYRAVMTKEQLEKIGYISVRKANDLLSKFLCDGESGSELHKKYTSQLLEVLDRVQLGEGKSTRFYVKENEVIAFIGSIQKGDDEVLILTQKAEKLKEQGYISGTIVGDALYKALKNIKDQRGEFYTVLTLGDWFDKEFKKLRKNVEHKTIGVGKATRHYYLRSDVETYLKDKIYGVYLTNNK